MTIKDDLTTLDALLEVQVAVTYTFVVPVPQDYESGDVSEAVMAYINSVGSALDNPVKIEEV